MKKRCLFVLVSLMIVFFPWNSLAEDQVLIEDGNGSQLVMDDVSEIIMGVNGDESVGMSIITADGDKSFIVEFNAPPVLKSRPAGKRVAASKISAALAAVDADHNRFRSDIAGIESALVSGSSRKALSTGTRINHSYKIAFNGVALKADSRIIEEIRNLPYVKRVSKDKNVQTVDANSNLLIGANQVWEDAIGATGLGVTIAVIDTGINAEHPAFEGKTIEGINLIPGADETDWDDDNKHGTHCAGIAAGNGGEIQGVAYNAALIAIKVLNSSGKGLMSTVIAGINYAADPDGDENPDGAVDVISLSIGGSGDPLDEVSVAINNAVYAGVVCVVAAGNSGPHTYTITSPGCAKDALTVGASGVNSNGVEVIAGFSSRGLTEKLFLMKPDLVAPGVDIYSSVLEEGYATLSGTSMATPHVAGAAALLLELHPTWTPDMVKTAIMQSAVELSGCDIWEQGVGRLDVYAATQQNVLISPAMVDLGTITDFSDDEVQYEVVLTIHNPLAEDKIFQLSTSAPASGISFEYPSQFDTSGNLISNITVTVNVDNNRLAVSGNNPPAYITELLFDSEEESIAIPFSIIKGRYIELDLDANPRFISVHNKTDRSRFFEQPDNDFLVLVPEGTYDVMVAFYTTGDDYYPHVVRENVIVDEPVTLQISHTEATHYVDLINKDCRGETIGGGGIFKLLYLPERIGYCVMIGVSTKYRFSSFSDNYFFGQKMNNLGLLEYHVVQHSIEGGLIGEADYITLENDPADFTRVEYDFSADLDEDSEIYFLNWMNATNGESYSTVLASGFNRIQTPYKLTGYFTPGAIEDHGRVYTYQTIYNTTGGDTYRYDNMLYRTSNQTAIEYDTMRFYRHLEYKNPMISYTADTIPMTPGNYAPQFTGRLSTHTNRFNIVPNTNKNHGFFADPYGNIRFVELSYRLSDPEGEFEEVQGNTYNEHGLSQRIVRFDLGEQPPREYELEMIYDKFTIQEMQGVATAKFSFTGHIQYNNPPYLTQFAATTNNAPGDLFIRGDDNRVEFTANKDSGIAAHLNELKLSYRMNETDEWTQFFAGVCNSNDANCDQVGSQWANRRYSASVPIPELREDGFYDLMITATDTENNLFEYKVEPAFKYTAASDAPEPEPEPEPFKSKGGGAGGGCFIGSTSY